MNSPELYLKIFFVTIRRQGDGVERVNDDSFARQASLVLHPGGGIGSL